MKKTYFGAITIFYRKKASKYEYLVVRNIGTGNISFVGGAQEDFEGDLIETARRENKEELDIDPEKYILHETNVKHEFVFSPKKIKRAGQNGSYQVFISDLSNVSFDVKHTKELEQIHWMSEEEVLDQLTFPDLKEVLIRARNIIIKNYEKN